MDAILHIYIVIMPAAITALWLWFKKRSDICERDRKQLWLAVARLSGIARAARSCPIIGCQLKEEAHTVAEEAEAGLDPDELRKKVIHELGVKEISLNPHYSVAP